MTSNPGGMGGGVGGGGGGGGGGGARPRPPPPQNPNPPLNKRVSVSFPLVREGNYLVSYTRLF
jgi:hypothetical protein